MIALVIILTGACFFLFLQFLKEKRKNKIIVELQKKIDHLEDEIIKNGQYSELGKRSLEIIHELNNPVGAIKANLKIVSDNQRDEIRSWKKFAEFVSPALVTQMVDLVYDAYYQQMQGISTRGRRQGEAKIKQVFEGKENLIEAFSFLMIYDDFGRYDLVLSHERCDDAIELVIFITERVRSMLLGVNSVNNLESLLQRLKSYGYMRDESKDQPSELELDKNIEGVMALFSSKLKGCEVTQEFQSVPVILGFPEQLAQVWSNLISNAIYANKEVGKICIRILNRTDIAVVEIEDEGGGVSKEIVDELFLDFKTSKPKGEGTGLGLGIAKKIVEKHNGKISFANTERGAIFRVIIPLL